MIINTKPSKTKPQNRLKIEDIQIGNVFEFSTNNGENWQGDILVCTKEGKEMEAFNFKSRMTSVFTLADTVYRVYNQIDLSDSKEFKD